MTLWGESGDLIPVPPVAQRTRLAHMMRISVRLLNILLLASKRSLADRISTSWRQTAPNMAMLTCLLIPIYINLPPVSAITLCTKK